MPMPSSAQQVVWIDRLARIPLRDLTSLSCALLVVGGVVSLLSLLLDAHHPLLTTAYTAAHFVGGLGLLHQSLLNRRMDAMTQDPNKDRALHLFSQILFHRLLEAGLTDAQGKGQLHLPNGVLSISLAGMLQVLLVTDEPVARAAVNDALRCATAATFVSRWSRYVFLRCYHARLHLTIPLRAPSAHERLSTAALLASLSAPTRSPSSNKVTL